MTCIGMTPGSVYCIYLDYGILIAPTCTVQYILHNRKHYALFSRAAFNQSADECITMRI